jgi:probable FeS assembly SUF system protein SufT
MTGRFDTITVVRDCMATTVPAGEWVLLRAGSEVQVAQQLGGSITVRTERGPLLRIDAADADALGLEVPGEAHPVGDAARPFHIDRVFDALAEVYDPEIPVSVVELGLVYRCEEVEGPLSIRRIEIDMTMTAPGCGMGDVLRAEAERAVLAVAGVDEVAVNLVWDPPWTLQHMSEAARLQLGLL